jgi:predicted dehydrogenase
VKAFQVIGPTGIDLALYGTLSHENDIVAQFDASFLAPRRQSLEVVGEDAVLTVQAPWRVDWPGELQLVRNGEVERLEVPSANSYTLQLENLADAVAGKAPALLGRDDALGQARTIDALYSGAASP